MFIYRKDKKATCDPSQLDDMKKAGWSTKPEPAKEPAKPAAKK